MAEPGFGAVANETQLPPSVSEHEPRPRQARGTTDKANKFSPTLVQCSIGPYVTATPRICGSDAASRWGSFLLNGAKKMAPQILPERPFVRDRVTRVIAGRYGRVLKAKSPSIAEPAVGFNVFPIADPNVW